MTPAEYNARVLTDIWPAKSRLPQHECDVQIMALGTDWTARVQFDATFSKELPDEPGGWDIDIGNVSITSAIVGKRESWVDIDHSELPADSLDIINQACIKAVRS